MKYNYLNSNKLMIIYINLELRKDKNKKILQSFYNHKITNFKRFNAINGNEIDKLNLYNVLTDNCKITRGQMGCYLSHKKCYEEFINSDKKYLLVLEDDIIFSENFNKQFESILKIVDTIPNFDFLYLSRSFIKFENMFSPLKNFYEDEYIYSPEYCGYGFHSYLLSKEGAKKYIKILDKYEKKYWNNNIGLPIDCLQQFRSFGKTINLDLNVYCLKKYIVNTKEIGSDTTEIN